MLALPAFRGLPALAFALAACVALAAVATARAHQDDLPLAEEAAIRAAVARVAPAVVRVQAAGVSAAALAAAEAAPASGPSTGLVVGPDGWVMTTSFAVPADAAEAIVTWPAAEADPAAASAATVTRRAARVVGRDRNRGLVLLKVEGAGPPAYEAIAPRSELAAGQWTIAVGRAWDMAVPSVAVGILSATNRSWGRSVQTDASISPANYGGPLVDIRGRVIGILAPLPADTAGMNLGTELYDAGIGFAVPMEDVLRALPRLERGDTLEPGVLGIGYSSRDPFTGEPRIATCRPGSPAAKAGLRAGDLIVAAGGRSIRRIAELRHVLAPLYAGDSVELSVERRPAGGSEERPGDPTRLDVRVELVAALPRWRRPLVGIGPARSSSRDAAPRPVAVEWVWPDSPAATAGIAPGDVVEAFVPPAVDGQPADEAKVDSAAALAGMVAGAEIGQEFGLVVSRDGARRSVTLTSQPMPGDLPAALPEALLALPAAAGREGATVERLGAVEMAKPTLAVVPTMAPTEPLAVLVFLDVPRGEVNESAAAAWKLVAARQGIAVILPAPSDPQRWGREDIAGIKRALAGLAAKRAIDPNRIAVAGRGAGGAFAWLVAEALGPTTRGVALIDSGLPRQATIEPVEPGRSRWILLGATAAETEAAAGRRAADRRRLEEAGYVVGSLPTAGDGALPVAAIAAWVEALGCL
ncbi:MAG: putative periplasmic serine endoprotease DegP-like precursor [Planctomycetota bacterium]|jgi:serine protease Do